MPVDSTYAFTVRVVGPTIKRLANLVRHIANDPAYQMLGHVSRSDVARVAMLLGLEELERRYGIAPKVNKTGLQGREDPT